MKDVVDLGPWKDCARWISSLHVLIDGRFPAAESLAAAKALDSRLRKASQAVLPRVLCHEHGNKTLQDLFFLVTF